MNIVVWIAIIAGFAILVLVAAVDLGRVIRRVTGATTPAECSAELTRGIRMSWVDAAAGAAAAICAGIGWFTDLRPDSAVWWMVGGVGLGALWATNTWWARRRALARIARTRPATRLASIPPPASGSSAPPAANAYTVAPVPGVPPADIEAPTDSDAPGTPGVASGPRRLGEIGRLIVFAAILAAGVAAFELASRGVIPWWAAVCAFVVFTAFAAGAGLVGRGGGRLVHRLRAR